VLSETLGGWLCKCDCGSELVVPGFRLRNGSIISCGCYHRERRREVPKTHGMKKSRVYSIWCGMKTRCSNPNRKDWDRYGGRGIKVCDEWQKFENFLADMGHPKPDETIERINVNGNYEKGNCRWITKKAQNFNKRTNRFITLNGITKSLAEWCEELDLKYFTIHARLRRGLSPEEALKR
jgi:hypothetical protein